MDSDSPDGFGLALVVPFVFRQTRCWSIVIIVIHTVALLALGFFNIGKFGGSSRREMLYLK